MQKILLILVIAFFSFFVTIFITNVSAQCAPLPTNTGSVTSTITITEDGSYTVWSRMQAPSEINNSYWLQIDQNCPINVGDGGLTPYVWTWVNYQDGNTASTITKSLSAGSHTITLVGREPGVKIDRVLFLKNSTCTPTGVGDDCITNLTATINVSPSSGTITTQTPLTVAITVDGGGQEFNAAQATVTVSPNLSIKNLTSPASNSCNFSYTGTPPSTSNPSFAGAILSGSSTSCTVFTMTLTPTASGAGTVTISNASVKAYSNNNEIFKSTQNGSYALTIVTPTTSPTSTPVPPTATPRPTSTPIPTATFTPTPTKRPTNTPTPRPTKKPKPSPIIDKGKTRTYNLTSALSGTKQASETILINDSSSSVIYPTETTWQVVRPLNVGENLFTVVSVDSQGNKSEAKTFIVQRNKLGDINGDTAIDLTDLSLFARDWQKTTNLTNVLSDNNEDGKVNLTDLSIIAKQYGK